MFKVTPYKGMTEVALYRNIEKFGKKSLKKTGINQLDNLINKLLEKNPDNRLTWDEYVNHPFFKEFNWITIRYEYNFEAKYIYLIKYSKKIIKIIAE